MSFYLGLSVSVSVYAKIKKYKNNLLIIEVLLVFVSNLGGFLSGSESSSY